MLCAGFLQQFAAVVDESKPEMHLAKVLAELSGGRVPNRVLCTGHSLGGALATLGGHSNSLPCDPSHGCNVKRTTLRAVLKILDCTSGQVVMRHYCHAERFLLRVVRGYSNLDSRKPLLRQHSLNPTVS